MVIKVDPFVTPIPSKLREDKELRDFFEYFTRWAHDMWVRSGAGNDLISGSDERISELEVDAELFARPTIKVRELDIVELPAGSTSITSTGDEFLICNNTAAATVTLNATPADGEEVIVGRRDAAITVNGAINGNTSMKISGRYSTMHFKYSIAANEWSVI